MFAIMDQVDMQAFYTTFAWDVCSHDTTLCGILGNYGTAKCR